MADQDVQGMLIRIEATTAQLRRELSTADRVVGDTSRKIDKHLGIADNAFDRLNSTAVGALKGLLLPIASVSSAVAGLSKAVEVQRQFDKLNAGLITATGSAANAASAFSVLQDFAQKTPYDLNQAVEGFTKLVNLGLTPSEKALMSYGNTAAGLGKDLSQLIEAVADATTGEFERLKEFGIKASQSGDKVALTFQGITKTIGNNAAEIENYLIALGENEFAGAAATRMATLDGALAGLGDSWDKLFLNINNAGLGELMQSSVNLASDALDELNALISSGQLEGYLQAIGDKFDGFGRDAAASVDIIQQAWMDATDEIQRGGMAYAGEEVVNSIIDTFRNLPENVRAFVQLMVTEVAVGLDKAAAYARAFKESSKAIFTDDTQEAVAARLQADLERINGVRADSIASILAERDASLQSFSDQAKAADQLREKSDSDQAAAAQATTDRLAQYKKVGSAATAASAETEKAAKKQADELKDFITKAESAAKSANAMADAYLGGADNVRELSIQEKVEQELLKTGVGAREAVTKAIREQQNAIDRRDLGKLIADTRQQTGDLQAQTEVLIANSRSVTEGTAAQSAYNIEKSVLAALAGKDADALQKETAELQRQALEQEKARKGLEAHQEIAGLIDSTATSQEKLNRRIEHLNELMAQAKTPEEITAIQRAMQQARNETSQWAQFTERQLDRVDQAFSDAWLNIGHGFDSFASSLKRAFEQMLAELAHMAITRPIMLQIGSALGVVSAEEAAANRGIWGSLFDVSGGQGGILSKLGSALSIDSIVGKLKGALGFGSVTEATSSAAEAAGSAATAAESSASAATAAESTVAAAEGVAASLSSAFPPIAAALALFQGFKSYMDGGRPDPKSTRGNWMAWTFGGQPMAEYYGAMNKLTKMVGLDGTVIGGILNAPGMIMQGISNALFGAWKIKDYGIALGVNNGDLNPQSYVYKKKKGLLTGTKTKTSYDPLTGDNAQQLQDAFATTEDGVSSLFEKLGYDINQGAFDGLQIARSKISTKGKTKDEISKAVQDWFTQAGDSITSYLNTALGTGLSYDAAGMATFVNNLYTVNSAIAHLNVGLFGTNVAGGKLVEQLLGLTGGLDALTSSVSTYYDQFFSDAEKQTNTLADVTQAFADANQTLPSTRSEYRAMVESIDLTTEAGRNMFATLMNLAGQADSYYDILEANAQNYYAKFTPAWKQQADTLAGLIAQFQALGVALPATRDGFAALVAGLDQTTDSGLSMYRALLAASGAADSYYSIVEQRTADAQATIQAAYDNWLQELTGQASAAFETLKRSIGAEQQSLTDAYNARAASLNDMVSTANGAIGDMTSVGNDLNAALKQLLGTSDQATAILHEQGVATLRSALAFARAGGSLSGFSGLQDALDAATTIGSGNYSTLEDMQREQGRTANLIDQLQGINGDQLTTEERILGSLQDQLDQAKSQYDAQIAALNAQLAIGQSQIDAINGVDNSVLSVAAAVGALNSAVAAVKSAQAVVPPTSTAPTNQQAVASAYLQVLGRNADLQGLDYWTGQLDSGALTQDQLKKRMAQVAASFDTAGYTGTVSTATLEASKKSAADYLAGIPAFAAGGDFSGGLRLVGENGPELEVTGPSRIFNARQTADLLSGGGSSAEEIRGLRADMAQVFDALRAIAKHTMQTAKYTRYLDQFDADGMPAVRA